MTDHVPGPDRHSPVWERWDEVDRLFEEVLDIPGHEQERYLSRACGSDRELYEAVRELLELSELTRDRLEGPGAALLRAAWAEAAGDPEVEPSLAAGERVGRYRIIGEVGRGGMATVFEAERADGTFHRHVALKVLRRGIDTDDVVRRFIAERQILSGLTHPNIARLLDGGATDDGRPFLVMDLVKGQPINRWADEQRLTVVRRLQLFVQVAEAVHYAHQRLVVHRDLKPSNILVTPDGVAKLLDFGIAKLLLPEAEVTLTGSSRPLTPQYASPEQIRGKPITTASDVYQLGILLHVLLVGTRPRGAAHAAGPTGPDTDRPSLTLRSTRAGATDQPGGDTDVVAIAAARATTPRHLQQQLRGDLDTIVLKALRAEPEERYLSALAMAEDARRYLAGHPVAARPASVRYRFRKFLERNPWVLPTSAALLIVGLLFGFTQIRHQRRLQREHNTALAQADRATQLYDLLVGMFSNADPYEVADPERGRSITVVEALQVGARRARSELADRPDLEAEILSAIGRVYDNLDQREQALQLLDESLHIRARLGADRTPDFAEDLGRYASLLARLDQLDSARTVFDRQLALERELFGPDHPRVANVLVSISNNMYSHGDLAGAMARREQAVRILRQAGPSARDQLSDALGMLADTYSDLQRPDSARRVAREALNIDLDLYGERYPKTAEKEVHLAQVLHGSGNLDEAIGLYRKALPVLDSTLGPHHFITVASWNNLGIALGDAGDYAGAEQVHRRILALRIEEAGTERNRMVAASLQNLAAAVLRQRRYFEAESLAVKAYDIYREVLPEGHYLRAFPLLTLAESQLDRGAGKAAERSARRALTILQEALPDHYATAAARCRLGAALALQRAFSDAEPLILHSWRDLSGNASAPARLSTECGRTLVHLYRARGRAAEAERLLREHPELAPDS